MKEKKNGKHRRSYDSVFKANILKLNGEGRTVKSLSESFGINENLIYRWKKLARGSIKEGSGEEKEAFIELKKEMKLLKEERDILKKALAIFSRDP